MQKTPSRATISEETFISIVIKDKRGRKSSGGIILPTPPPRADFDRGRPCRAASAFFGACAWACRLSGFKGNNSSALRCPGLVGREGGGVGTRGGGCLGLRGEVGRWWSKLRKQERKNTFLSLCANTLGGKMGLVGSVQTATSGLRAKRASPNLYTCCVYTAATQQRCLQIFYHNGRR